MNLEIAASIVTLVLETGERFTEIPLLDKNVSLGEFLDQSLKALEVSVIKEADV